MTTRVAVATGSSYLSLVIRRTLGALPRVEVLAEDRDAERAASTLESNPDLAIVDADLLTGEDQPLTRLLHRRSRPSILLDPQVVGDHHYALAQQVRETIAHYRELQDIISLLGIEELGREDRLIVGRARRLQRFLTQPFMVTQAFTGQAGRSVALTDTLQGVAAILAGVFLVARLYPVFFTGLDILGSGGNFIVDVHPDMSNVWLMGSGMAEGFKFGPVLGEYAANRILCQDKEPQHADSFRIPLAEFSPQDTTGFGGPGGGTPV